MNLNEHLRQAYEAGRRQVLNELDTPVPWRTSPMPTDLPAPDAKRPGPWPDLGAPDDWLPPDASPWKPGQPVPDGYVVVRHNGRYYIVPEVYHPDVLAPPRRNIIWNWG